MSNQSDEAETNLAVKILQVLAGALGSVLLIIVFFGLFMPLGFVVRLISGDPLHRKLESSASTYYHPSKVRPLRHMDKPF